MSLSKSVLLGGIAAIALTAPALAEDRSSTMQKEQYIYQQTQNNGLGASEQPAEDAIGATQPRSGPGVQGPPDTRTGPSTRAPGDDAGAGTGASTGEAGSDNMDKTTKPSQDSSGVQGFPDTRTGPSTHDKGTGTESGAGSAGGTAAP